MLQKVFTRLRTVLDGRWKAQCRNDSSRIIVRLFQKFQLFETLLENGDFVSQAAYFFRDVLQI
jgi:hypothetical protein